MQKKIIALAIAGLASTAAFAQTNVTIYGVADAGLAWQNNGVGQDTVAFLSGALAGNRLGFKGTEDLGNGLKAVFTLEQGYNINDGTQTTSGVQFQRQAFVGLSSAKAGSLTLGRQYAPGYYASCAYDALVCSAALSPTQLLLTAGGAQLTIAGNSNARWSNSVNYATPNFGGFEAQVIYRAGAQQNNIATGDGYGLGVKYAGGPVSVSYVYHNSSTPGINGASVFGPTAPGNSVSRNEEHFIGASFDLKVVKLLATAQILDANEQRRSAAGTFNEGRGRQIEVYGLGAIVPVGKGNIHAQYAYIDLNQVSNNNPSGTGTAATIAYTHPLSKRTTLYTGVAHVDLSHSGGLTSVGGANSHTLATSGQTTGSQAAAVNGGDGTTLAFGVNHTF